MATRQIAVEIWVGGLLLCWAAYPLLLAQTQGVLVLSVITALLASLGCVTGWLPVVMWSAGLGVSNLTLALLVSAAPPNLWVGLSAGIILLALVDGAQRLTYIRRCWLTPGVLPELYGTLVRLSGLTLGLGLLLGVLIVPLKHFSSATSGTGVFTVLGACLLVGALAVFLRYTSRLL